MSAMNGHYVVYPTHHFVSSRPESLHNSRHRKRFLLGMCILFVITTVLLISLSFFTDNWFHGMFLAMIALMVISAFTSLLCFSRWYPSLPVVTSTRVPNYQVHAYYPQTSTGFNKFQPSYDTKPKTVAHVY